MAGVNVIFFVNKIMNILPELLRQFLEWLSLTWQFASLTFEHCDFLNIDISQGSVATYLRYGGIFKHAFIANLPLTLPMKKFRKSVNIWGSYGQEFSVLFFDSLCSDAEAW